MTPDTITIHQLCTLRALVQIADETLARVIRQIESSDITTDDAAAIVNETIETITTAAQ